jgi:hypothetical protein
VDDQVTSSDENQSPQSFHCPICGSSFAAPGFDPTQLAAALARHLQASHGSDSPAGRGAEAASGLNQNQREALPGEDSAAQDTEGEAAHELTGEPSDDSSSPADDPAAFANEVAAPSSEAVPEMGSATPETDTSETDTPDTATPDTSAANPQPQSGNVSNTVPPRGTPSTPNGQQSAQRCPRCGVDRRGEAICPSCASTMPPDLSSRRAEPDAKAPDKQRDKSRSPSGNQPTTKEPGKQRDKSRSPSGTQPTTKDSSAKKIAGAVASGERPKGKDVLNEAIDKGVQTAAASIGVPPVVTKVLITITRKVLPYLVAASLVMTGALFGGVFGDDAPEDRVWDVPLSEQLDIPEPYIDAYQNAARQSKVPWTLLAAIGAQASYHGRINPYLQTVPNPAGRGGSALSDLILVGDSLSQGTDPYLRALILQSGASYRAVVETGVRTAWGSTKIAEIEPAVTATIVVGLGTNDSAGAPQFAKDVDTFMSGVALSNTVWWLTIDKNGAEPYNLVLLEKQQRWPNMRVADWKTHVTDRGITTIDGLHYDAAGYQERARFIASNVTGNVISGGVSIGGELTGPGVLPTPEGGCPTLPSPIEGDSRTQGAGPLMLVPAVLESLGQDLDTGIQNICESADALADVLAQTAQIAAAETGMSFPRGIAMLAQNAAGGDVQAAEEVHRFWAEVIDRSGVLGTTSEQTCEVKEQGSLENQDYVGDAIDSYWRCALNNASLVSVRSVNGDTTLSYDLLEAAAAVARGVEEALSVAWTWSQWGGAACDPEALVAGIFPMTQVMFDRYAGDFADKDRCNVEASIVAAANAFVAGETTPAATRPGTWQASIGGWVNFTHVAGGVGPTLFDTEGPWEPLGPSLACSQILANALVTRAGSGRALAGLSAATVQSYIAAGLPPERHVEVDTLLDELIDVAQNEPACAVTRTHPRIDWLGAVAGSYNGDALTGVGAGTTKPRLTSGDLMVSASIGDIAAVLAARAQTRATAAIAAATPGTTPLLERFAHSRLQVPVRPAVVRESSGGTLSLGSRIINISVGYYGGLFVTAEGVTIGGIGLLGSSIPYADVFNAVGQEYGIDPRLLAAVAKQESNFNAESGCPSSGPAYGMMQKEPDMVPSVCGDPRRQVTVAAEMLLVRFSEAGDWRGALWGYNNGGVFSRKWRELDGDVGKAESFAVSFYCDGESTCTRAEIAMKYISDDPSVRSTLVAWLDYQRLFPAAVISTSQLTVSGADCPNTGVSQISGRTLLRDGSEVVGMRALCAASVAAASTPEAARAIIFTFKNLGIIYDGQMRNSRTFDCSSYVSRAYVSAGLEMKSGNNHYSTHTLLAHSGFTRPDWIVPVPAYEARPGDLVFPHEGHVAMLLADGFMIHTSATGDVSHVEKTYASPLQINRVIPAIAPRVALTS